MLLLTMLMMTFLLAATVSVIDVAVVPQVML